MNPKNNFPYREVKYSDHVCFHSTRALYTPITLVGLAKVRFAECQILHTDVCAWLLLK